MKRVEILGIEGIGKTTLYEELVRCRSKRDVWITTEEARARVAYKYIINNKKSLKSLFAATLLRIKINEWLLNHLCDDILSAPQENNFLELNETYGMFLRIVLDYYAASEYPPKIRLIRIARLYKTILKLLYLDNDISSDVFLSDSSTISMAGLLLSYWQNRPDEQIIKDFFENMPIPTAIIYCYLDQEEVIHRILDRKNYGIIALAHRDPLNYNEIVDTDQLINIIKDQDFCASRGVNILKNRGARILEIDMKDLLKYNIEKISHFLGELE